MAWLPIMDMDQACRIGAIDLEKAGPAAVVGVARPVIDADTIVEQKRGGRLGVAARPVPIAIGLEHHADLPPGAHPAAHVRQ
jgi:hypothetical protein